MKLFISASELAVLTGHNRYRDKSELIVKYWKKYFPDDFKRIQHIISSSDKQVILPETARETVKRIVKQNNIKKEDVGKLYDSSKKQSSMQMQTEKQKAMDKIISSLPKKDQEAFKKSANSVVYTSFGTRNEYNGVELFSQEYNVNVSTPGKYYSEELFIIEHDNKRHIWSIGGKIDGNDTILEIKNRVKGLFNTLRDYEKVQCFAYMFALDKKTVSLAECYKTLEEIQMNVIGIPWDDDFWNTSIVEKLEVFVNDFYDFLDNDEKKIKLIS